ncbi:MAG: tryptophan synthase subunit alpha [Candidatus Anoxymicrobium japonicum]|uniref:Tryptophan synthase alpha chain n=1 Tax=Candidatus Anoxymicrobium japonicum TaxID=2013648 RepID=A0A2N3G7G0_9ACTN|nr:MAG: tryptophan synthase subunit alpha [Candidatus Anoxymicrobium japonicum]
MTGDGGRLSKMFSSLRGRRPALIAYATGFFPDREKSLEVVMSILGAGADAVEIGMPFSDPVMDGPVIQKSSAAALEAGATPDGILEMVSELRGQTDRPLLVMTYYNLVFRFGPERFARRAAECGVDGIIIPDLPAEEMAPFKDACGGAGVDTVAFCSVTTSPARIREAVAMSTGFLYCVSLLGPTGARSAISDELPGFLTRVRENADCPIAAGLGISTPEQCAIAGSMADGVIVGSALVKAADQADGNLSQLTALVASMAKALRGDFSA